MSLSWRAERGGESNRVVFAGGSLAVWRVLSGRRRG